MRTRFRDRIKGSEALKVGIDTGKNMANNPRGAVVTAMDLGHRMREETTEKAERHLVNSFSEICAG